MLEKAIAFFCILPKIIPLGCSNNNVFLDDFSHQQVCLYLYILFFLLLIRVAFLDVDIAVKDFGLPACTWSQAQPPVKREQLKR